MREKYECKIVQGGPRELSCKKGIKTILFESALKLGGGMPGGGIMFNKIVVQKQGLEILEEFGIRYKEYESGYYVADALEATACLTDKALKQGAKIFNLIRIEDVVIKDDEVCGVVVNWTSVDMAKLHIDLITFKSKAVIDATGHPCEIAHIIERKSGGRLLTPSGKIEGEKIYVGRCCREHGHQKYPYNISWTLCLWYGCKCGFWWTKDGSYFWWYVTPRFDSHR